VTPFSHRRATVHRVRFFNRLCSTIALGLLLALAALVAGVEIAR
jgi:hypothetical protein